MMKFIQVISLYSLLMTAFPSNALDEDQRVISPYYEFEEGSSELLYGDNVVFRSGPSSSSKPIDTLGIGSEIKIIEKSDEKAKLNGIEWNWYKVKFERKIGYVLGGLIALDHVHFDDALYLVTMAGIDRSTNDYEYTDYKVRTRVLTPTNDYYGHESNLNTSSFYIEVGGNRGLDGIGHIFVVNLYAEACGVDGGQIYLFNDGLRLIEALQLSVVSDAGAFWYSETVVFPDEEEGWDGVVRYEREQGEYMDDDLNWTKATVHSVNLEWKNGQFTPDIEKLEFDKEE